MADKIIHLILIESDSPIGMDEITRRVAVALEGQVVQIQSLRQVGVELQPAEPAPLLTHPSPIKRVRAKEQLRVRPEPNTIKKELGFIDETAGEFPVLAEQVGWYKILWRGKEGWISSKFAVVVQS